MEEHIKQSYPRAFEIGSKIYDVITQHTGLDLYKSERVLSSSTYPTFIIIKIYLKLYKENST